MIKRILAGIGANSFGMAASIGIQLLSLPIFLHYWNTEVYGGWLLLSALPSYLAMADVGMVTAAGNKMTMAIGRGDFASANSTFHSAQLFMLLVCGALALIAIPIVMFVPLPGVSENNHRIALLALSLGVLLALFGGLSEAVFKATERYAVGSLLSTMIRIAEWIGYMLGLALVGNYSAVAICGLLARAITTGLSIYLANNRGSLTWGLRYANKSEIKTMIKPATSFMAFPIANALSFQGVTILVGTLFGSTTVAIFNTYRTIARLAVQATAIFSHSLWPEFSRLHGKEDLLKLQSLFKKSTFIGTTQAVALSFFIYYFSPFFLKIWTHGSINFDSNLMIIMLVYAAISGIWHVPRILLMSTNQHNNLAYWAVGAGLLAILLTWFFGKRFEINGTGIAMLLSEFFIALACVILVQKKYFKK